MLAGRLIGLTRLTPPVSRASAPSHFLLHRNSGQHIICRLRLQHGRFNSTLDQTQGRARSRRVREFLFISFFSVFFTSVGFLVSTVPAAASVLALMTAPASEDALRVYRSPDEVSQEIEKHLNNHPIAQKLSVTEGWKTLRPHLKLPDSQKRYNLTAGTLLGPGKFPVPPLIFSNDKELVSLVYVGTEMCGHVGVVHGGLIATMLDEGLAWCGFGSLPNKIGMTAFLNINYRKPVPAGSYLLLRAETVKSEGRKVWVKGTIEKLRDDMEHGDSLVDAEALYVEPKFAKFMPKIFQESLR